MRLPICEACARTKILCGNCSERLNNNDLSQADVSVSQLLSKLERKSVIPSVDFERAYEVDDAMLLILSSNVAPLIGKGGRIVRLLSEELGKKVRIIGKGDARHVVQDLVSPARLMGLNVVYSPAGEEYKIIIPKEDQAKLFLGEQTLKKAASVLLNRKASVTFA